MLAFPARHPASPRRNPRLLEWLEARCLLCAVPFGGGGAGFGEHGQVLSAIQFSQTPAAVQTGLDTLATTDGLTDPSATQSVKLGNKNGVETYSVTITGTGTVSRLTVDQNGKPVTAPTQSTTTWATLSGTGTGSDTAAANEITAIATAQGLTAPTATTVVNVSTSSGGAVTYSIRLAGSSTTAREWEGSLISVDAAGNPVGNQNLPFSVMPTTIQTALNANAPTGAIALTATSTQTVAVRTFDGATTYSTTFTVTGIQSTVTINAAGQFAALPTSATAQFSAIPSAAQTELQTLANDYGFSGTITAAQTVNTLNEGNGTTIFSVTLSVTTTLSDGSTFTHNLTIAVDQAGNPTTLPGDGLEGEFAGFSGGGESDSEDAGASSAGTGQTESDGTSSGEDPTPPSTTSTAGNHLASAKAHTASLASSAGSTAGGATPRMQ